MLAIPFQTETQAISILPFFGAVDGRNPAPPWDVKHHVNNRINYQPQLVTAGFLNHQQYQEVFLLRAPNLFFKVVRKKTESSLYDTNPKFMHLLPIGSMGLVYLSTFTIKINQMVDCCFFPDGCLRI